MTRAVEFMFCVMLIVATLLVIVMCLTVTVTLVRHLF